MSKVNKNALFNLEDAQIILYLLLNIKFQNITKMTPFFGLETKSSDFYFAHV